MTASAVLIGTLDTKGREYAYVRDILTASGVDVVLVDVGVLREPGTAPDIPATEVAAAAGIALAALRGGSEDADGRAAALDAMRRGAIEIVRRLREAGRCDGVLGLGGSGGSALLSAVMRSLPFGVPKVLVSTMASGDVSSYVGVSDLCLIHSVTDIAGLNRISRPILRNAAGALAGMLATPPERMTGDRPAVGVTMLGVTTPCALRVVDRLDEAGMDAVVFHTVGSGGRALESLLASGVLTGVIDLTVKEITDDLLGGVFVAGPERMRTAGRRGLPQVVVPGAVEVINFGAFDTVPEELRDGSRPLIRHNEQVTAVRATREELLRVADEIADRLNQATGRIEVLIPRAGFDSYAAHDGPFADAASDIAFGERLAGRLRAGIPVVWADTDVNDPGFADLVADRYLALAGEDVSPAIP
ncbi:Tm-1-like ATP-binding domain-containing protein [Microbacterium sp. CIAB417]|uniref:Tm-1-like ATP-binding domain-containing protein n=1 Tax=Microbacterium sp. CIAB417 TaxID=2860287 RepID=UPI001FAB4EF1|nr:Tm-1-like ATP-binding domain-containing protein [Microbacterium sp. CIAB417]